MSVPRDAASVGIRVTRSYDNDSVFLRSESDRLFSELVNASVGKLRIVIQLSYDFVSFIRSSFTSSERVQDDQMQYCICDVEMTVCPRPNGMQSSKSGAAIAIGVAISVMCLGVTVIVVIAILCWWR